MEHREIWLKNQKQKLAICKGKGEGNYRERLVVVGGRDLKSFSENAELLHNFNKRPLLTQEQG